MLKSARAGIMTPARKAISSFVCVKQNIEYDCTEPVNQLIVKFTIAFFLLFL
jgi:hypothetical protein